VTLDATLRRHVAREAVVSALINGALSLGFTFLAFSGMREIQMWGASGLVVDSVPQGFMTGLMGALVPSLLTRRAVLSGRLHGATAFATPARHIVVAAILSALLAAALLTGVVAAILAIEGSPVIGFGSALVLKTALGAALGALVTTIALNRLLRTR